MNTLGDVNDNSGVFIAKYKGTCAAECGEPILPGEAVKYVGTVLIHNACDQALPAQAKPTKFQGTSLEQMGY